MIRRTLPALLLGLAFVAEPCLAPADTNSNTKKPPKKPAPQVPQTSPPTKSSRHKPYKYRSLDAYHPHAKGKSKRPGNT
jgi:hypothetical protein